jgi:hypothetical protein
MNLNFEFVNIKASGVVLSKIIHLGRSGWGIMLQTKWSWIWDLIR